MNDSTPTRLEEQVAAPPLLPVKAPHGPLGVQGGDFEFELNTDSALIDQRWFDFEEQHQRRFGLAIDHLKARVKGRAYDNDAMKLRVGSGGYYTQSQHFPAAFFGDTGSAQVSFVSENEAAAVVWEAVAHYRSEEARSLTAIYSDDEPPDFFFGYRVSDWRRYEIGFLRTTVPLHLRVLFDSDVEVPLLGATSGTVIYQRTRNGKHVLVRSAGRRQPLLGVTPLG
ncbi:MAG: hypothetical protein WDA15_11105 [Trueperaceae bacterium]|jgi:hypothetical protein